MASFSKRLVLLVALMVMPLQGIAAPLSVLACQSERPEHAAQAMVVDDLHDDGMRHDTQPRDEGGASGQAGHFCCHNVACGLLAVARQPALAEFAVRHSVSHPLNDLFFPDRPQRPPLA